MDVSPKPPDPATLAHARRWLEHDPDPHTRAVLARWILAQDFAQLVPAFTGRLRFGTAGLRALMGPGPRALNNLVVRQSCAGIAEVLKAQVPRATERGVAIGFDGRHNSRTFAEAAAGVFLAQGFAVHFCEQEVPTPVIGFWVKTQQMAAGIVITASHNPPAYNGVKVYWHDGAQIVSPQDTDIARAIDAVAARPEAPACWTGAAFSAQPRLSWIAEASQAAYLAALRTHLPTAEARAMGGHEGATKSGSENGPESGPEQSAGSAAQGEAAQLRVAYTPLHGVGALLAQRAVRGAGLPAMEVVAEQALPDGDFPTVAFPNPEEPGSMALVLALAEARGCALACANDPDADRLAVAARDGVGALRMLSGDELGCLLADFLLEGQPKGTLVATTRASSRMLGRMARSLEVAYEETLTGFKWLARAGLAAAARGQHMAFAYEEALGYAVTTLVWDKDGISALVAALQLAVKLQARGETLWDRLAQLQARHGVFVSGQQTVALDSAGGAALMQRLRAKLPRTLLGKALRTHDDLLAGPKGAQQSGSDVLILYFGDAEESAQDCREHGLRVILRPSGTEPKLKIYYELVGACADAAAWQPCRQQLQAQLQEAMRELGAQIARTMP